MRSQTIQLNFKLQDEISKNLIFIDDLHVPKNDDENILNLLSGIYSLLDKGTITDFHNVKFNR
jgi:hypothetical protein